MDKGRVLMAAGLLHTEELRTAGEVDVDSGVTGLMLSSFLKVKSVS